MESKRKRVRSSDDGPAPFTENITPYPTQKSYHNEFTDAFLPFLGKFVSNQFRVMFGCDTRSLAFWRVLLGLVVFIDLHDRLQNLGVFYTDSGILRRDFIMKFMWNEYFFSFHLLSGEYVWVLALWLVHMAFAILVVVGFKTRFSCFMIWILHVSMQQRNPIVLHNGDVYLRLMLLFAVFLPMSNHFSIDSMLRARDKDLKEARIREEDSDNNDNENQQEAPTFLNRNYPYLYCSGGTIALLLQIAQVYMVSVLHKYRDARKIWFFDADATYYALNLNYYSRQFGQFMLSLGHPVLRSFTYAVLAFEAFGPFFLFFPLYTEVFRWIAVTGFVALHLGFGCALKLEVFYLTGLVATVGCLPEMFWTYSAPVFYATAAQIRRKDINFYTRKLTLSYSRSHILLARFFDTFSLVPNLYLHLSASGTSADIEKRDSSKGIFEVQDEAGKLSSGMSAVMVLLNISPLFFPFALLLSKTPSFASFIDRLTFEADLYTGSSSSLFKAAPKPSEKFGQFREQQGESSDFSDVNSEASDASEFEVKTPRHPDKTRRAARRNRRNNEILKKKWTLFGLILGIVGLGFGLYCLWWNLANFSILPFNQSVRFIALSTMTHQTWSMFSPPPTTDWFHVMPGTLRNGTTVELLRDRGLYRFHGAPMAWTEPDQKECYPTNRWHKIFESVNYGEATWRDLFRGEVCRWICQEWNVRNTGDQMLTDCRIYLLSEKVHLNFTRGPQSTNKLFSYTCPEWANSKDFLQSAQFQ